MRPPSPNHSVSPHQYHKNHLHKDQLALTLLSATTNHYSIQRHKRLLLHRNLHQQKTLPPQHDLHEHLRHGRNYHSMRHHQALTFEFRTTHHYLSQKYMRILTCWQFHHQRKRPRSNECHPNRLNDQKNLHPHYHSL